MTSRCWRPGPSRSAGSGCVTYCNKGTTGNAGQMVLRDLGFGRVDNLSGGNSNYQAYRAAGLG
jgi:rhodanese-related sulfurtransferase